MKKNHSHQFKNFVMVRPPDELYMAYFVIKEFEKVNNITYKNNLIVKVDFALPMDGSGCYYYEDDKFSIHINPFNCCTAEEYRFGNEDEEYSFFGYITDLTMYGVAIHEYCHFLCWQIYPTLLEEYKEEFPTDRLYLSDYTCRSDHEEELVELMHLYFENPMFLKMLNNKVYLFFKRRFKSPSTCSHKNAFDFYKDFPEDIKRQLKDRWKIVYNVKTKKFERNDE